MWSLLEICILLHQWTKRLTLERRATLGRLRSIKPNMIMAHLHYIRDPGPSIRVRDRTQSKQVNCCFAFTLIRVQVRDFCLGRPCPSSSLHVAISSAVHMDSTNFGPKWPWPRMTSDPSLRYSVKTIMSGSRTRILRQCKRKCALNQSQSCQLLKNIFSDLKKKTLKCGVFSGWTDIENLYRLSRGWYLYTEI